MSVGVRYVHKWLIARSKTSACILDCRTERRRSTSSPTRASATRGAAARLPEFKTPKPAKRDYDAVEVRLRKRLRQPLVAERQLHLEPAVRQLRRLASSDENGPHRPERQPLLRRALHELDDAPATRSVDGPLYTDRPHRVQGAGHVRLHVRPHGRPQRALPERRAGRRARQLAGLSGVHRLARQPRPDAVPAALRPVSSSRTSGFRGITGST